MSPSETAHRRSSYSEYLFIRNQVDDVQSESMRASPLAYEAESDLADPPQRPVWPKGRSALFGIVSGLLLSAGGCWKMKCSRDDNPGRAVEHVQLKYPR